MLTANDIKLIRQQFRAITSQPCADTIGGEFLARIFWATPEARSYFPSEVFKSQEVALELVRFVVDRLHRIGDVVSSIEALMWHAELEMPPPVVEAAIKAALLGTLASRLESAFSNPARCAWSQALETLFDNLRSRRHWQPVRKAA